MWVYFAIGLIVWLLFGFFGYLVMRADYWKTFGPDPDWWDKRDRLIARIHFLSGPIFLIGALLVYLKDTD